MESKTKNRKTRAEIELMVALVMNTECAYRNYDTDYVFHLSRHFIKETMDWLTTN
jgi:hypothetical protein